MKKEIKLKQGIRKGTIIKELYPNEYFYKIDNKYVPCDFNDFKHPLFVTNPQ